MAKKIEKKAALASLNDFLSEEIKPVQLEQVRPVNTEQFGRWVRRNLTRKHRRKLGRILKPLIDKAAIEGVIFQNATLVEDGSEVDVAILAVPKGFKALLRDTDVFIVYADDEGDDDPDAPNDPGGGDPEDPEDPGDGGDDGGDNTVDTCQYMRCFCANPSNCSCVTATQFNKECPDSTCSSDSDCGGSGDGGVIGIYEVITVF